MAGDKIVDYLLILTALCILDQAASQGCRTCSIPVYQRRVCREASLSVTETECRDAGCCFDGANYFSLFYRVNRCYQPSDATCPSFTCNIPQRNRKSCGNINFPRACQLAGCCYDQTGLPNCYGTQPFNRSSNTLLGVVSTTPLTIVPTTPRRRLGAWSRWAAWTPCSETCSRGTRTRQRICIIRTREVSLSFCDGEASIVEDCNTGLCQKWGNWVNFGICNAPCNRFGTTRVTRTCEGLGSPEPSQCRFDVRSCGNDRCQPQWGSWLQWSRCASAVCGPGTRFRYRQCAFNGVSVGVRQCQNTGRRVQPSTLQQQDATVEMGFCNSFMCNLWTAWSSFGRCICGQDTGSPIATRQSTRSCFTARTSPRNEQERNTFNTCAIRRLRCLPESCEDTQPAAVSTELTPFEISSSATLLTVANRGIGRQNSERSTIVPTDMPSTTELKTTAQLTTETTTTPTAPPTTTTATTTTPTTITTITTTSGQTKLTTLTVTATPETLSTKVATLPVTILAQTTSQPPLTTQPVIEASTTSRSTVKPEWGRWSPCSSSCGPGTEMRVQKCISRDGVLLENSPECSVEGSVERRACNADYCQQWEEWVDGDCVANCANPTLGFGIRQRSRSCADETQQTGPSECFLEALLCFSPDFCSTSSTQAALTTSASITTSTRSSTVSSTSSSPQTFPVTIATVSTASSSQTLSSLTTTSSAVVSTSSIPQIRWNEWDEWGACSQSCESGLRVRSRTCMVESLCKGDATETGFCNNNVCNAWSSWSTTCTERCGGGTYVEERRCLSNMETGPEECYRRLTTDECNTQPCDRNLDILFLLDSSDFVDNCRRLRRENYSVPISSQLINEEVTPVYVKMKEFITEFMEDWRYVENQKTRVGIQLISKACSARTKQNLNVRKHFDESHENFTAQYIDLLPYECGSFFLDLALTCAEKNVFIQPKGDRENVPNVVVALLSRVPSYVQPSDFLLSAISRRFDQAGITAITAGVTPLSRLSRASSRKRYEEMLKAVSCQGEPDCPKYIGSIWDEDLGRPAERIRRALLNTNDI